MGMDLIAVRKLFFDQKKVLDGMDRATAKSLSRFGAFVRTRSRSSIRKRKATSAPGSPPSSHVGTLRNSIYFSYDPARRSVVIGPVPFNGSGRGALALEEGGQSEAKGKRGRGRRINIKARPFMGPAFRAELPNAAAQYKGMFR